MLPCCVDVVLETMPVKLYGRSHPDPKTLRRWSTLRVMGPVGVKGERGSRVTRKVHGFKGLRCRRFPKVSKVLGRQVFELKAPRVKGFKTCRDIFFNTLTTPHPTA